MKTVKNFIAAFHDTDILARILADTSDTCDFLKLFLWQAERGSHPTRRHLRDDPLEDVGRMSVSVSWNVALSPQQFDRLHRHSENHYLLFYLTPIIK